MEVSVDHTCLTSSIALTYDVVDIVNAANPRAPYVAQPAVDVNAFATGTRAARPVTIVLDVPDGAFLQPTESPDQNEGDRGDTRTIGGAI